MKEKLSASAVLWIGHERHPRVLLVDDSWFQEGHSDHLQVWSSLTATAPQSLRLPDLARFIEQLAGFRELAPDNRKLAFDLDLLNRLARRCEGHFQLGLCSSGAFEQLFERELDRANTACLVSVGHRGGGQGGFLGPEMLEKLLRGNRPKAEILYITGYPEKLNEHFETRWNLWMEREEGACGKGSDPAEPSNWWVLRSFPVIIKYRETLDVHLDGFFRFFSQRFREDQSQQLAMGTHLAQSLNPVPSGGGDPAHLNRLESLTAWEERFGPFPGKDAFEELAKERGEAAAVESFKALFSLNLEARYGVDPVLLRILLGRAGIDLQSERTTPVFLPSTPGSLFLIGLLRYAEATRENPLKAFLFQDAGDGSTGLEIALMQPEVFLDATLTRNGGGAVDAFRQWLAGHPDPLLSLAPPLADRFGPWERRQTRTVAGHRPVWRPIFSYSATPTGLRISWNGRG